MELLWIKKAAKINSKYKYRLRFIMNGNVANNIQTASSCLKYTNDIKKNLLKKTKVEK